MCLGVGVPMLVCLCVFLHISHYKPYSVSTRRLYLHLSVNLIPIINIRQVDTLNSLHNILNSTTIAHIIAFTGGTKLCNNGATERTTKKVNVFGSHAALERHNIYQAQPPNNLHCISNIGWRAALVFSSFFSRSYMCVCVQFFLLLLWCDIMCVVLHKMWTTIETSVRSCINVLDFSIAPGPCSYSRIH